MAAMTEAQLILEDHKEVIRFMLEALNSLDPEAIAEAIECGNDSLSWEI